MQHGGAGDGVAQLGRLVAAHAFRELFVEELGWDRLGTALQVRCREAGYALRPVAQKRGLAVYECTLPRLELRDRVLLRAIQREVRRYAHESLLLFADADQTMQVWQWAVSGTRDGALIQREHPFRSVTPPPAFLERLTGLRVELADEEGFTLLDALARTSGALDRAADTGMFFRRQRYLYESARLAAALADGGLEALHRFIAFHDGLARWTARRYERTGVDLEDVEQMARVGLIRAAQRFDTRRDVAFSTYAVIWTRQACRRYIQRYLFAGSLRAEQFARLSRILARNRWHHGDVSAAVRRRVLAEMEREPVLGDWSRNVLRILETGSLDAPGSLRDEARARFAPTPDPGEEAMRRDDARVVRRALAKLPPRDALVIRRRYGIDREREEKLDEIASSIGLTRERVRQIQVQTLARLRILLVGAARRGDLHCVRRVQEIVDAGGEESS